MRWALFTALLLLGQPAIGSEPIKIYPGYVSKIHCEGRLLVSAVGNDSMVRLEALPKDLGCGVLLKPLVSAGQTNLILETTGGTVERLIEVGRPLGALRLVHLLKGDGQ